LKQSDVLALIGGSCRNRQLVPKMAAGHSECSPAKSVCCDARDRVTRCRRIKLLLQIPAHPGMKYYF